MEHFHDHRFLNTRGFTLLELLVVVAIITIVTGIAFTSQSSFNKTLIATNAAYDVALSLRNAETYGLGSRGIGSTANAGYGLDFSLGTPDSFVLFADTLSAPGGALSCHPVPPSGASSPDALPGNCLYDGAASGERIQTYTLNNGIFVSRFCAYTSTVGYCSSGGTVPVDTLDVTFSRPNPTPFFAVRAGGTALAVGGGSTSLYKACVTLASSQGGAHSVTVWWNGAIATAAGSCP